MFFVSKYLPSPPWGLFLGHRLSPKNHPPFSHVNPSSKAPQVWWVLPSFGVSWNPNPWRRDVVESARHSSDPDQFEGFVTSKKAVDDDQDDWGWWGVLGVVSRDFLSQKANVLFLPKKTPAIMSSFLERNISPLGSPQGFNIQKKTEKNHLENLGKYHFLRQLWLVLGVKLLEINSNWFSRHPLFSTMLGYQKKMMNQLCLWENNVWNFPSLLDPKKLVHLFFSKNDDIQTWPRKTNRKESSNNFPKEIKKKDKSYPNFHEVHPQHFYQRSVN